MLVKTFLLMYQVATNERMVLTELRWFQLVSTSQNSISNFFEKKIKFLGFHAVVFKIIHEDLSIDVAINYQCRTDIDKAKVISAL